MNSLDAQFIYEINWTKKINFDTAFSGGQIKRIALIKTILKKANIYLLDEPFSDLPQVLGLNFLKFFKESNINAPLLISVHSSYYDNLATNIKILEV